MDDAVPVRVLDAAAQSRNAAAGIDRQLPLCA